MAGIGTYQGLYYDGESAVRHQVELRLGRDQLIIQGRGEAPAAIEPWPYSGLHDLSGSGRADEIILSCDGREGAQLVVRDTRFAAGLRECAPDLAAEVEKSRIGRPRMLAYAGLALGLCLAVYFALPGLARWAAPLVPVGLERDWGEGFATALSGGGKRICRDPAGRRALDQLARRLTDLAQLPYAVRIQVLNEKSVNAITLPGGFIFIFSGLLAQAETSEEVAGVLAHELGHVAGRHIVVGILQGFALELAIGSVTGGAAPTALLGEELMGDLLGLSFTRGMETEADGFAQTLLARAGIRQAGLIDFFERLKAKARDKGGPLPFLSTHPPSESRLRALGTVGGGGGPALSDADWQALRKICGTGKPGGRK